MNIRINDGIPKYLLDMKLTDMFCKHVVRRESASTKADKLYD